MKTETENTRLLFFKGKDSDQIEKVEIVYPDEIEADELGKKCLVLDFRKEPAEPE